MEFMNLLIFATIFFTGIGVGYVLFRKKEARKAGERTADVNKAKAEAKAKNKKKVIELLAQKKEITNNDVEGLLGVSDATATNYLDELQEEGHVAQVGTTGRGVHYTRTQ